MVVDAYSFPTPNPTPTPTPQVPLSLFLELEAGDIFVIDSSHRLMQRVRPRYEKPIYTGLGPI